MHDIFSMYTYEKCTKNTSFFIPYFLAQQFNFTYRYIEVVLSLKNTKFAGYLEFIYPSEHEIKETTETAAPFSHLDCYLYIDSLKHTTRFYEKRDDFNLSILNFPFLSSNIPSAPA